jgi:hypothetical protein
LEAIPELLPVIIALLVLLVGTGFCKCILVPAMERRALRKASVKIPPGKNIVDIMSTAIEYVVENGKLYQRFTHRDEILSFEVPITQIGYLSAPPARTSGGPLQEAILSGSGLGGRELNTPLDGDLRIYDSNHEFKGSGTRIGNHLSTAMHVLDNLKKTGHRTFYISKMGDLTMYPVGEIRLIAKIPYLDQVYLAVPDSLWSIAHIKASQVESDFNSDSSYIQMSHSQPDGSVLLNSGNMEKGKTPFYVSEFINTRPGDSGGAIRNGKGKLVAIHLGTVESKKNNYGSIPFTSKRLHQCESTHRPGLQETFQFRELREHAEREFDYWRRQHEDMLDKLDDYEDGYSSFYSSYQAFIENLEDHGYTYNDGELYMLDSDYMRESKNFDASASKGIKIPVWLDPKAFDFDKLGSIWFPVVIDSRPWYEHNLSSFSYGRGEVMTKELREKLNASRIKFNSAKPARTLSLLRPHTPELQVELEQVKTLLSEVRKMHLEATKMNLTSDEAYKKALEVTKKQREEQLHERNAAKRLMLLKQDEKREEAKALRDRLNEIRARERELALEASELKKEIKKAIEPWTATIAAISPPEPIRGPVVENDPKLELIAEETEVKTDDLLERLRALEEKLSAPAPPLSLDEEEEHLNERGLLTMSETLKESTSKSPKSSGTRKRNRKKSKVPAVSVEPSTRSEPQRSLIGAFIPSPRPKPLSSKKPSGLSRS